MLISLKFPVTLGVSFTSFLARGNLTHSKTECNWKSFVGSFSKTLFFGGVTQKPEIRLCSQATYGSHLRRNHIDLLPTMETPSVITQLRHLPVMSPELLCHTPYSKMATVRLELKSTRRHCGQVRVNCPLIFSE